MMTLTQFATLEQKLAIRRTIVLMVTLWMTYKAFDWAAEYVMTCKELDATTGLVIAAVTAPITYLQQAVFNAYIGAKETK